MGPIKSEEISLWGIPILYTAILLQVYNRNIIPAVKFGIQITELKQRCYFYLKTLYSVSIVLPSS